MPTDSTPRDADLDRRTLLSGLSAAATMGLAGCGGSGGGDGDGQDGGPTDGSGGTPADGSGDGDGEGPELGERVPKLNVDFFATLGQINEDYAELSTQDLREHLDLNVEATPREHTSLVFELYGDERNSLLPLYIFALEPDPNFSTQRLMAHQAGSGIKAAGQNTAQWVNCDYSVRADAQAKAFDRAERQRLITEAWSIASHELPLIPISTQAQVVGFRTDRLDVPEEIWPPGLAAHDWEAYTMVSPTADNDVIQASGTGAMFEILNPFVYTSQSHWSNVFVNSPLLRYDRLEDYEVKNLLADAVEFSDDGRAVTVEVRDDASFHNGDPVTAADVKFTYDYLVAGSRAGQHTFSPSLPALETISTVDDRTVEFELSEPYAPLADREFPTWGIVHKESWMDALSELGVESFEGLDTDFDAFGEVELTPDHLIGSGPYELTNFETTQSVSFSPVDDHPVFAPEMDIDFINKRDPASRLQSLRAGDLNVATLTPKQSTQVEDDDSIRAVVAPRIQNFTFFTPNCAAGPTKFLEFRQAVAAVLNRREMVQVSQLGLIEPEMYSVLYTRTHPWRPPEDMLYRMAEDPTGSPEMGRAVLEDAGWGWDDNDNLRYPAGADLEPLWPKGGAPDPDEFPCLNQDGYVRPEGYEMTRDQVPGYET